MMNEITIRVADWQSTEALRDIRRHVFIDEQQIPEALEWDLDDPVSTHFLLASGNEPIGTARLLSDGHIGRVAILPIWRGRKLGQQLMFEIMRYAEERGMNILLLSAQSYALDFYRRLGFEVCSEEYLEAGIGHLAMRRSVGPNGLNEPPTLPPIDFESPARFSIHNPEEAVATPIQTHDFSWKLGQEPDLIEIDEDQASEHLCWMLDQARRQVLIYGADRAIWLFNRRQVILSLERLIARQPKARIRVLLHEASKVFLQGHSLLNLMHRFPSLLDIRKQHPERTKAPHVYMLVDNSGILMLPKSARREGFIRYNSPDQVRRWNSTFDDLWSSSQSDPAIRRFLL
jgi:predicted GNAT family N-acyltransferase